MKIDIIFEDENLLVIDKPPGIIVANERNEKERSLMDYLIEEKGVLKQAGDHPRYGLVHRLDKDTSGVLLIAKDNETLDFLQNQFKQRKTTKKYLALVIGEIKENKGETETFIGRSPKNRKKQKVYFPIESKSKGIRKAKTNYRVIKRFENYTLLELEPKTGRKHQIRCHLNWMHHPITGDSLYGFKNQPKPKKLRRHFLHASYLKVDLPQETKEFKSDLPEDLKEIIKNLKEK
jgi:23S rRNA pseudouridine1911/1915/1917 synthase